MKKLGLRAVAGGLAVLLVASVFAPAKAANAADMLVTAAAPKTLVITADMVDDDGEIVISNENWDRIIVENGVDAKDIYFDGVDVKELVVESGSKSRVQLWEVDAAQVTVQEPEFNEISLKDILPLLADKETQQAALNMYLENKQAVAAASKLVPTVVTKEGAKVEALVARANAKLDLADGDVAVVALEASDKLDRATVTLKNYDGDVTYKGNDKFSSMTLKNVNSNISLTVDESTDKNYFTVTGKNSLVEKAEVAGNAKVSLDAPMGVVEISEKATAAQVTILDNAEEMKVASKGAKVELTMNANVALATVTADNVKVEGQGTLKEAKLEGKGAYVSTNGTKVEGENTYVKPEYVKVLEDIEYQFSTLAPGGWGNTRLGNTDGGETYKLNGNYGGEVFYVLPESVDATYYSEAVIKVKTEPDQQVTVKLTAKGADKDDWGNPVPFFSKTVTGEAEVIVPLEIHGDKVIEQVRFQSTGDEVTATFFDVNFKLNPNGPSAPIVAPTDGTQANPNQWEVVVFYDVDFRQYAGATVKISAEAMRCGGSVGPKAQRQFNNDPGWTQIEQDSFIEIGTEWTDFGAESFKVPAAWADAGSPINYGIRTVTGEDYSRCLIYYKNFNVEVLEEAKDPNEGGVVLNFEDGVDMVSGCGATFAQADTAKTGNKAWQLVSAAGGYAAGTFATALPEGKTMADMASVKFDYYIVTSGIQYKQVRVLMGTELANDETTWNGAAVNTPSSSYQDFTSGQKWNTCTTSLKADATSALNLAAGANFVIGIGMMGNESEATYYIDNVRLVDADGNEYLLQDFESEAPTFGVVNWGVKSSQVSTVDLSAYGDSMLQITNSNWGQGVTLKFTLPSGKTIADYSGLQMNVWLPSETYAGDDQKFTYKDFRVNAATTQSVSLPEGSAYVGWATAGNQGAWTLVEVANWDTIAAAVGSATTFYVALGVNTPSTAPYYIDNVILVAK